MPVPEKIEGLEELPGPAEILELRHGESREFTVLDFQLGQMFIHPRDGRAPGWVKTLRVMISPDDKPAPMYYWDITSQHAVAWLHPSLEGGQRLPVRIRMEKEGEGPRGRYKITILPAVSA